MPFKSDKQRKWMFANEPEMAREWVEERASGGLLKKAIANSMNLQDYSRMRSGGMIKTVKKMKGVADSNTALCNKFRDS
tara:strand:- start:871 stop:1107 length:237 start_codon:yes stop_codon:yes gene_type:complete